MTAALLMVVALLPAAASAQTPPPPENVDTVNTTGDRFILDIDGTKFDVEPEEMSLQAGALQFCETCEGARSFGSHTFEATLKGTTNVVATLTAEIQPSDRYDYALVFHHDRNGDYALSLYRDDVSPMPGDETRFEVRHVAKGGAADVVITPNGENPSAPGATYELNSVTNPQWARQYGVPVNDYELRVYEAGATRDKLNLAGCNPDLELEGAQSIIVYIGGQIVPADQLDPNDVDTAKSFADVCRDLADAQPSWDRGSYNDGFELRGYAALVRARDVVKDPSAPNDGNEGPGAPFETTAATGGSDGGGSGDELPTTTITSPADGTTVSGSSVSIEADASDDDAVTKVEFFVDGTKIGEDTTAPYTSTWDSTSVNDGNHDISVDVTDSAGQQASSTVTVKSDNGSTELEPGDADASRACPDHQVPDSPFIDIGSTDPHERNIECIYWYGITQGTSSDTYSPRRDVSRGNMARFIARLMEETGYTLPSNPGDAFRDDEGSGAELRINQLAEVGVVNGYGDGTFRPNAIVDRAEMATFIMRALRTATGKDATAAPDAFDDDQGSTHEANINALAQLNISKGTAPGQYSPNRNVNRAAMGSFLARALDVLYRSGEVDRPS